MYLYSKEPLKHIDRAFILVCQLLLWYVFETCFIYGWKVFTLDCHLLQDVAKGKYAADTYVAHVKVTKDQKNVLLVTDR